MKIAYIPYSSKTNKYVEISKRLLNECGAELINVDTFAGKMQEQYDAIVLNWYETLGTCAVPFLIDLIAWGRELYLFKLKKSGVKIVTTFHNRVPHDVKGHAERKGRSLLKRVLMSADIIIILSQDSRRFLREYISDKEIDKKCIYIPHPNYIGVYSDVLYNVQYPQNERMQVLFMGAVRPYKNVELLIELAKRTSDLPIDYQICGGCPSAKYRQKIEKMAQPLPNVQLDIRFVPDNQLDERIRFCDIMILPYDVKSSINSGSVLLSFSNGRSVICPRISALKDFPAELVYGYEYTSEAEHIDAIEKQLVLAWKEWTDNRFLFEEKGKKLFEIVKSNHSSSVLKSHYIELLKRIAEL